MRVGLTILLSVWCAWGAVGSVFAQAPLAERLPAETLLYAGWAGTGLTFDGSGIGQFLNEPVVSDAIEACQSLLKQGLPEVEGRVIDHLWAMGAIAWRNPTAVALTDLKPGEDHPVPSGVLLIRLGRDSELFTRELDALVKLLESDETTVIETSLDGLTYKTIKNLPCVGEISWGFIKDLFFVAGGSETVRQLIQATGEKALAANSRFTECWKSVGGQNTQLGFYVDVPALLERIKPSSVTGLQEPQTRSVSTLRKLIDALGVGKVTAIAGSVRIIDRRMYTRARLFTPAPHKGLLAPFAGGGLSDADFTDVPEDADGLVAIRLSPQLLWDEGHRVLRQINPQSEDELLRRLARLEKDVGVSISNDILSNLGDTVVLSGAPSQGGFLTGTILSFSVKDSQKLAVAIAKIEARFRTVPQTQPVETPRSSLVAIETLKAGRVEIHYLRFIKPRGLFCVIAPAWAIHKDHLYLALWPQVISSVVANNGTKKALTAEANFRDARARLSANPSVLCYLNTPQILRQTYHLALIGWTAVANVFNAEGMAKTKQCWLPALGKLEKYFPPDISAVYPDEDGITFEGYGSVQAVGVVIGPLVKPVLGIVRHLRRQGIIAQPKTPATAPVQANQEDSNH